MKYVFVALIAALSLGFLIPSTVSTMVVYAQQQTSGNQTSGNQTSGNQTSGNQTSGNQTSGNQTSGNQTSGNQTSGNQTSGNQTSGNQTSGNQTSGNQTSGNQTSGNQTSGNQTSGNQTSGNQTSGNQTSGNQTSAQGVPGQFVANMSGKNLFPPVNSNASGQASFNVTNQGKMAYSVKAHGLDKVSSVSLEYTTGGRSRDIILLYDSVMSGPTGKINGVLTQGSFSPSAFLSDFSGKHISDLVKAMADGNIFLRVLQSPYR